MDNKIPPWQLKTPIPAIIFDCDGTLSAIEGIDELAKYNGVGLAVQKLTAEAMGTTGITLELYQQRLELVHPTQQQVLALGKQYFAHLTPDVDHIIQIYLRLKKMIYIVSAGLMPAICIFGELLHIPKENIFSVDIQFDADGRYFNFDHTSPLVTRAGKRHIVNDLKTIHTQLIYIGDGLNDLETKDLVTRFVGYGGAYYRKNISDQCQFYINTLSMAALLPLTLTQQEYEMLTADEQALYNRGLAAIHDNTVKYNVIP